MTEPHRILVGYDGSRASDAALAWAETTAREKHARLTVVTVLSHSWCATCWPGMAIAPVSGELERGAAAFLRAAVDALAPDVSVTSCVLSGPVGTMLSREARRQDCDLIVIGRGRRWLRPWASQVERYLRHHSEIPVATIAVPRPEPQPAPEVTALPALLDPTLTRTA